MKKAGYHEETARVSLTDEEMRRNRRLVGEQGGKNRAPQEDSSGGKLADGQQRRP
jgi:hypothetical protein